MQDPLGGSNYATVKTLGSGNFGFVLLARNLATNEHVAIKLLRRDSAPKYVEAEILNHSKLWHPHIVDFKEVFLTREYICLAMEYASGDSLKRLIRTHGRLQESSSDKARDVRWYFHQLVIAMDYCHRKGVINRDIKLENILLMATSPPVLKICDFGLSKNLYKSNPDSRVGTPVCMAPEVLTARGGEYDGKAADVWSCGVALYIMLFGCHPFTPDPKIGRTGEQLSVLTQQMLRAEYVLPEGVSVEVRDLLRKMLCPDPAQRISIEGVMRHPWFACTLPPAAYAMNDEWLDEPPPEGRQSTTEIERVLAEANLGSAAVGTWGDVDNFIDDAIFEDGQQAMSIE